MRQFNLHARTEIGVAMLLLLSSCSNGNQFNDKERDEIGDLAGDVAYDIVLEHDTITDLNVGGQRPPWHLEAHFLAC